MPTEVIVAAMSLLGTFGGIIVSSRITNYRLEQLENVVREHNNFAKRMPVVENKIENLVDRVDRIEGVV